MYILEVALKLDEKIKIQSNSIAFVHGVLVSGEVGLDDLPPLLWFRFSISPKSLMCSEVGFSEGDWIMKVPYLSVDWFY